MTKLDLCLGCMSRYVVGIGKSAEPCHPCEGGTPCCHRELPVASPLIVCVWVQSIIQDDGTVSVEWRPGVTNSTLLRLSIRRRLHALGETVWVIAKATHDGKLEALGINKPGRKKLEKWLQASPILSSSPCVAGAPVMLRQLGLIDPPGAEAAAVNMIPTGMVLSKLFDSGELLLQPQVGLILVLLC